MRSIRMSICVVVAAVTATLTTAPDADAARHYTQQQLNAKADKAAGSKPTSVAKLSCRSYAFRGSTLRMYKARGGRKAILVSSPRVAGHRQIMQLTLTTLKRGKLVTSVRSVKYLYQPLFIPQKHNQRYSLHAAITAYGNADGLPECKILYNV